MTLLLEAPRDVAPPEVPVYLEELASEIREEYDELPGLRLTEAQIRRRWLLTEEESAAVIDYLVRTHYLVEQPGGCYALRPSTGTGRLGAPRDGRADC